MKVIILGAGSVGITLAECLSNEGNDVTLIDINPEKLRVIQDNFDIRTLAGQAGHPDVLTTAGAEDADILVAVTAIDEVNLIACQIAHTLFQIPTKIARVRATQYTNHGQLFVLNAIPVDVLINPELLVQANIKKLIEYPNTLQVLDFVSDTIRLIGVKISNEINFDNSNLTVISEKLKKLNTKIIAIYRDSSLLNLKNDSSNISLKENDEIFFITDDNHVKQSLAIFKQTQQPNKKIIIAGGGNIGALLGEGLQDKYKVKIIDNNLQRIDNLANTLDKCILLHGDATDKDLLLSENIETTDIFCALTNSDDTNIMASMLAKSLGVKKVITLICKPEYIDIVDIDVVISPQQISISSVLTQIRNIDAVVAHSLRRGRAEAIEAVVHGNNKTSKLVGRKVLNLSLPKNTILCALIRDQKMIPLEENEEIKSGDHLILFVSDKQSIMHVEEMFQLCE